MTTISFELFPPKTQEGYDKLLETIKELSALRPQFFSVTYGAGGSSREKTLDLVSHIEKNHQIPTVAHLTCVMHTKDEIHNILNDMRRRQLHQVLALRGDPPKDNPSWTPGEDNFQYASDLVRYIRIHFKEHFAIGVAGFPEGHVLAKDRESDADIMLEKVNAGADFIITQLFFDNKDFFEYKERLKKRGIDKPLIAGILIITDYAALTRFCATCGATIPQAVHDLFGPIAQDPEATREAGITFAVNQCRELIRSGIAGLHFYTLNKISPTKEVLGKLKSLGLFRR